MNAWQVLWGRLGPGETPKGWTPGFRAGGKDFYLLLTRPQAHRKVVMEITARSGHFPEERKSVRLDHKIRWFAVSHH